MVQVNTKINYAHPPNSSLLCFCLCCIIKLWLWRRICFKEEADEWLMQLSSPPLDGTVSSHYAAGAEEALLSIH